MLTRCRVLRGILPVPGFRRASALLAVEDNLPPQAFAQASRKRPARVFMIHPVPAAALAPADRKARAASGAADGARALETGHRPKENQ